MLNISNKTEETVIFKFDGNSEIDILDFSNTLKNISEVINNISVATNKELYLNLKIVAIQKGSFEFNLKAIAGAVYSLLPTIKTVEASQILKAFCELLNLKQWLSDEKVQSITNENGNVTITKSNGLSNKITNTIVTNIFLNDKYGEIEKSLNQLGYSLPSNKTLTIKAKDFEYNYNLSLKDDLQTELSSQFINENSEPHTEKTTYSRYVTIKKPDLEMKSLWEVTTDKVIRVIIKDEDFKNLVLNKQFTFFRGKKLYVELEEETEFNSNVDITNVKYSILKVLNGNNSEQLKLI